MLILLLGFYIGLALSRNAATIQIEFFVSTVTAGNYFVTKDLALDIANYVGVAVRMCSTK